MGYFLDNNQLPSALKHGLLFPGYNKHRTEANKLIFHRAMFDYRRASMNN